MPTVFAIPKLAVVELTDHADPENAVAFGVVVSARRDDNSYMVELVDPKSGNIELVEAPGRRLRIKRAV